MTCISDHAKILLIYYKASCEWLEISENFTELKDAEEYAADQSAGVFDIYEVRIIRDDKRIFVDEYYIKRI